MHASDTSSQALFRPAGYWDYPLSRAEKLERVVAIQMREVTLARSAAEEMHRREDAWRQEIAELQMQLGRSKECPSGVNNITSLPTPMRAMRGYQQADGETTNCAKEIQWSPMTDVADDDTAAQAEAPLGCRIFHIGLSPEAKDMEPVHKEAAPQVSAEGEVDGAQNNADSEDDVESQEQGAASSPAGARVDEAEEAEDCNAARQHPAMDLWLAHMMADYNSTSELAPLKSPERDEEKVRKALDLAGGSPDHSDQHGTVLRLAWRAAALELVGRVADRVAMQEAVDVGLLPSADIVNASVEKAKEDEGDEEPQEAGGEPSVEPAMQEEEPNYVEEQNAREAGLQKGLVSLHAAEFEVAVARIVRRYSQRFRRLRKKGSRRVGLRARRSNVVDEGSGNEGEEEDAPVPVAERVALFEQASRPTTPTGPEQLPRKSFEGSGSSDGQVGQKQLQSLIHEVHGLANEVKVLTSKVASVEEMQAKRDFEEAAQSGAMADSIADWRRKSFGKLETVEDEAALRTADDEAEGNLAAARAFRHKTSMEIAWWKAELELARTEYADAQDMLATSTAPSTSPSSPTSSKFVTPIVTPRDPANPHEQMRQMMRNRRRSKLFPDQEVPDEHPGTRAEVVQRTRPVVNAVPHPRASHSHLSHQQGALQV
eukprot:gnl/TRDRNA2_/TRDRNA2_169105_c0_seq3.p1 gnl/TRDRNA2_/TRDRNA2_169105_c0~~gnl/TRDRNA2_/TRDRNA2_169105_c0_seq3.p1  ORF type:complete len:678 (-),score=144.27 gnl/TRDRNA2_/TRDRNA2_169105_c0_seq3:173-2140(-)